MTRDNLMRFLAAVLHNLVWPAAAGNVAWAFFTLAIQEPWTSQVCARLAALFLLALYLAIAWYRTQNRIEALKSEGKTLPRPYWIADAGFILAIIIFSIAIHVEPDARRVDVPLYAVFVIAALGHFFNIWDPPKTNPDKVTLGVIDLAGTLILLVHPLFCFMVDTWHRPIALFVVLVLWFIVRQPLSVRS